jgi:hypothetical protein
MSKDSSEELSKVITSGAGGNILEKSSWIIHKSTTNLLNALKVSGRNKDGLGIGFLNAITEKTDVTVRNTIDNNTKQVTVSPLTNYNVTVLDQRFNQNSSVTFINGPILFSIV